MDSKDLIDRIDDLLPQTQCARCGYPACRPYAEAIAGAGAAINRCPPGGENTIAALANLLEVPVLPPDPDCGEAEFPPPIAVIDERLCIGCTLCIRACPVDAIIGARRWMHTVLAAECTGCALCIDPCPMDCIRLDSRDPPPSDAPLDERQEDRRREKRERRWQSERAPRARRSHRRRCRREEHADLASRIRKRRRGSQEAPKEGAATPKPRPAGKADTERRRAVIAAALERERTRQSRSRRSTNERSAGDRTRDEA